MNKEISNEEVLLIEGLTLNDRDILSQLNSTLKSLVREYTIAIMEASNKNLFDEYNFILQKLILLQRETFELMFKKGWYKLEKVDLNKIKEKYNCLNNKYQSLNE